MMRVLRTKKSQVMLLAAGCAAAGCMAALIAANDAPPEVKPVTAQPDGASCQAPASSSSTNSPTAACCLDGTLGANANKKRDLGSANACADGMNGVFNSITGQNDPGANIKADTATFVTVKPDGTVEDLREKSQRGTISSRSWRQIFPRAN
jgi:hypothetical protein